MEVKVKKRDWVKNAIIIFLAVMLVLTFCSNTIMNRSLPEVATQAVVGGEITTRVRGTGTVVANENYEVVLAQTREIESVKVKQGDEVNEGDVLFTLSAAQGGELTAAEDALYSAQMAYQRALINASASSTDEAVARAREALEDSEAVFAASSNITAEDVATAKRNSDAMKAVADARLLDKTKADNALENAGGYNPPSGSGGDYSGVETAAAALTSAQNDLAAKQIQYQDAYNVFEDIAELRMSKATIAGSNLEAHKRALYDEYSAFIGSGAENEIPDGEEEKELNNNNYTKAKLATAYNEITQAENAVNSARTAYNSAYNSYWQSNSNNTGANYQLKLAADRADLAYQEAQRNYETARAQYDNFVTAKSEYDAAKQDVYSKQDALSQAMANVRLGSLELQDLSRAVARAQENLSELSADSRETEITAKVSGVIQAVNATAGKSYEGGTTIATIEIPDQGYIVSFAVTNEQARRVRQGDEATISNYYMSDITATLDSIRTDPQNPQTSKILVFDIQGEVAAGTSLTLSVGQRSSAYDTIVPNSAVRSDANGSFVLIITAKNSPLGNRYIATRVDVEIAASDDTNSAVTGAISPYDYVITTSSKPVENKTQVKLADS